MRVLGVDPGLQCTGYGIIEFKGSSTNLKSKAANRITLLEAGIIRTKARDKLTVRLKKIYAGILEVSEKYNPDVIALEELYSHYQNPRTAIIMAHARGVICLVAANTNINVVDYAARKVKKAITGTGTAKKIQMQKVVKEILNLKKNPEPHDVADALALAITHLNVSRFVKFNAGEKIRINF
ncbi:MAG: crossover junction endodeoxyribonuclease RuvC [Candidatus Omnitrophota bacterium]